MILSRIRVATSFIHTKRFAKAITETSSCSSTKCSSLIIVILEMNLFGLQVLLVSELFFELVYAEASYFNAEKDVIFLLRMRNRPFNDDVYMTLQTKSNIRQSGFDSNKPTMFLIHGYLEDRKVKKHFLLSKTFLDLADLNFFFVDWSKGAKTFVYKTARERVFEVAKVVGTFARYLHDEANLNYDGLTLIGFSLGAHIAGIAGKRFLNGQLKKIVGLDPAGPLFDVNDPDNRLSDDSAQYTECLHTGYFLGIKYPICKVDIYFNGGSRQPNCVDYNGNDFIPCSHGRALDYYTEALKSPKAFYAYRCQSLNDALNKNCEDTPGMFVNGPDNDDNQQGIYHVITNKNSSYGRGRQDTE